jgi:hypothetical protein
MSLFHTWIFRSALVFSSMTVLWGHGSHHGSCPECLEEAKSDAHLIEDKPSLSLSDDSGNIYYIGVVGSCVLIALVGFLGYGVIYSKK